MTLLASDKHMKKQHLVTEKLYYGFPVVLISYYDENGTPNIATMSSSFSLDNMIALGFGKGGHAVSNILKKRQFVLSVPDRTLMGQIETCGFFSGSEHQKFKRAKLTPVESEVVDAPLIQECPLSIECVVEEIFELPSHPDLVFVFATVAGRKANPAMLNENGTLNATLLDPVLFVGDGGQRVYRYLECGTHDVLGSFLEE